MNTAGARSPAGPPRAGQLRLTAAASTRDAEWAVQIHELRRENRQLARALLSRAVVDQARGMVMALAPCTGDRAWGALVEVSQHSNVKLRDVAAALVATTEGVALQDPLRRELRRVLRGLRAADRR